MPVAPDAQIVVDFTVRFICSFCCTDLFTGWKISFAPNAQTAALSIVRFICTLYCTDLLIGWKMSVAPDAQTVAVSTDKKNLYFVLY